MTDQKHFETCGGGQWSVIDLTGPAGPSGGADGEVLRRAGPLPEIQGPAFFRVTTQCTPRCALYECVPDRDGSDHTRQSHHLSRLGLSLRYERDPVPISTSPRAEVPAGCFTFSSMAVQAMAPGADSVNANGTPTTPFFTTTSASTFMLHPTKDLVKIPVTGLPANTLALPLTPKAVAGAVVDLTPTLSMSFPLGFQDLYTDVGHINAPFLGECDQQGGVAGYGCLSKDYDFSTTNDTDHGSSGSPLFDVDQGFVIGVASAGTDGANADYTWAIDAFHITEIK